MKKMQHKPRDEAKRVALFGWFRAKHSLFQKEHSQGAEVLARPRGHIAEKLKGDAARVAVADGDVEEDLGAGGHFSREEEICRVEK